MRSSPNGRWVAGQLLGVLYGRAREAAGGLAPRVWFQWLAIFVSGAAATFLVTAGLTYGMRYLARNGTPSWDRALLLEVATLDLSFYTGLLLDIPGNSVFLIPFVLFAAGLAVWWHRPVLALSFVAGYAVLDLFVGFGWLLWARERPTLVNGGFTNPGGIFHSFPSGHVAQAVFAFGLPIALWIRASRSISERIFAAGVLLLIVGAVSMSRLIIGAHWPSDVLAGLTIGAVWLGFILYALGRAEARAGAVVVPFPSAERPRSLRSTANEKEK